MSLNFFLPSLQETFVLPIVSIRGIIVTSPIIMNFKKLFGIGTCYKKLENSKSEPSNFSRLCTCNTYGYILPSLPHVLL